VTLMRGLSTLLAMLASLVLATASCAHGPFDVAAIGDDSSVGEILKKKGHPAALTRSPAKQLVKQTKSPSVTARITFVGDELLPLFGELEWSPFHPRILSVAGPVTERGPPVFFV
jgi:hypothetical protein